MSRSTSSTWITATRSISGWPCRTVPNTSAVLRSLAADLEIITRILNSGCSTARLPGAHRCKFQSVSEQAIFLFQNFQRCCSICLVLTAGLPGNIHHRSIIRKDRCAILCPLYFHHHCMTIRIVKRISDDLRLGTCMVDHQILCAVLRLYKAVVARAVDLF